MEYNNGLRDHYEYKEAMFTNSRFKTFLINNGLNIWKESSTRDVICLEFKYGTRSYQQEMAHLKRVLTSNKKELRKALVKSDKHQIKLYQNRLAKIKELFYFTKKKNGEIKKREVIHYKMLYRSTGKAKKGSCMFIRDEIFDIALDYIRMGIKLEDDNPMIVEISAYSPLIASGTVGEIKINPKNILILKDVKSFFKTNVISIEIDKDKHCKAEHIKEYELHNTLFDGEALIDSGIFPTWGNGYVLLRQHLCKMAAFNTNIQMFFKDYFGDKYYTATVKDMFGNEHYVKDIELITTDNAMKWLKFGISYDYWCDRVYDDQCLFGVVKTAHPSKLGNYQKMSYQMVNSLSTDIMKSVSEISVNFVQKLKSDNDAFIQYLSEHKNFSNDYEVLVALCEHNPDFANSSYFRERKKAIIKAYVLKMKSGEIMQEAENLTVCGSPYALLLYAATGDENSVNDDDTFFQETGTIQCYTERFNSGEHLAFFRSPFNSKNNLLYLHNVYHRKIEKYFKLGRQCIAINMIGTDAQDRANGMDQDSDFGFTTNNDDIVKFAKESYLKYPTIVNNIPKETNTYKNCIESFAAIDNKLAKSQTDIGESSNLAQLAQTYACSFPDVEKYANYVCILSVLAQVAIDNAKRTFDIDLTGEISRIKKDMDIPENKYPDFWSVIKHGFKKENLNHNLTCPMNKLYDLDLCKFKSTTSPIPIEEFFIKHPLDIHRRK